jgi:capsid protein
MAKKPIKTANQIQIRSKTAGNKADLAKALGATIANYQEARELGFGNFGSASDVGRTRQDWTAAESALTAYSLQIITNRALRAYHSNTWLQGAMLTLECGILSPVGIKPTPKVYMSDGKIDKKVCAEISKLWKRFNDECCDYLPLQQNEGLILDSAFVTGNCFIVRVKSKKTSKFSFKLEFFDTSNLDFNHDTMLKNKDGSFTQYGISYDKEGQPVKYYFKEGNVFDAKDVIHIFIPKIAQQRVGISAFMAGLATLYDIEMMLQNQILTTRVGAGLLLWMKKEDGVTVNPVDDVIPMSPLNLLITPTKPEPIQGSNRVSDEVVPLIKQGLESFGASVGISYSSISRNLEGESFSGGRLRNMMDEQTFDKYYKWFSKAAMQQIYIWFMDEIVKTRMIKSISIEQYRNDPYEYQDCHWYRKKPDYIDPLDQVRVWVEARDAGIITDKELLDLAGKDLLEHYEQLAFEIKKKMDMGITQMASAEKQPSNAAEKDSKNPAAPVKGAKSAKK